MQGQYGHKWECDDEPGSIDSEKHITESITSMPLYTLLQKKCTWKPPLFSEVPRSPTPTSGHFDKIDMTLGQGQWPRVTDRTWVNQCALLLEKSVNMFSLRFLRKPPSAIFAVSLHVNLASFPYIALRVLLTELGLRVGCISMVHPWEVRQMDRQTAIKYVIYHGR